jgi:hypothetical protein
MSRLWLPPKVDRQLKDSTARFNADVESKLRFNTPVCAEWNHELQRLDPRLRLAKAVTDADAEGPGLRPGFYHLVWRSGDDPITLSPLTGPNGEYAEPTSQMLETLRANDLQSARVALDRARAEQRAEREQDASRQRDEEARHEELDERWAAVTRTQVSLNDSVPWAQNVAGFRRTRGIRR